MTYRRNPKIAGSRCRSDNSITIPRCALRNGSGAAIRPPPGSRAKAATAASISAASRTGVAEISRSKRCSVRSEFAKKERVIRRGLWIEQQPDPLDEGAISFSSSSHFPIMANSTNVKPVMFPPGRAWLAIKPCPRGSLTTENTIGIVLVACFSAAITGELLATINAGDKSTSSLV